MGCKLYANDIRSRGGGGGGRGRGRGGRGKLYLPSDCRVAYIANISKHLISR